MSNKERFESSSDVGRRPISQQHSAALRQTSSSIAGFTPFEVETSPFLDSTAIDMSSVDDHGLTMRNHLRSSLSRPRDLSYKRYSSCRSEVTFNSNPMIMNDQFQPIFTHFAGPNKRLVSKDGTVNVVVDDETKDSKGPVVNTEWYSIMHDFGWSHILIVIFLSLILSLVAFSLLWYVMITYRGDLDYRIRRLLTDDDGDNSTAVADDYKPCITNVDSLFTTFLFSLETQTAIGYGSRYPTDRCPESIALLTVQIVFAIVHYAIIAAMMTSRFLRPDEKSANSLTFSKFAAVDCDHFLSGASLIIRIYDYKRRSRLIINNVWGVLIARGVDAETRAPSLY